MRSVLSRTSTARRYAQVRAGSSPSVLPTTRHGGSDAQPEVDGSRHVSLSATEPRVVAEKRGGRPREERPRPVGAGPEEHEDGTEHQHLRNDRPVRGVHELGKEGEEEERRLRIEDVHDDALEEDPTEAPL